MAVCATAPPQKPVASAARFRPYLLEAQKSALLVTDRFTRQHLLEAIAAALAKTGDFDSAFQIAMGIYPAGYLTVREMGTGMAAAGRTAEAGSMAKRLPGGEGDTLLAFLAQSEAQSGNFDQAMKTGDAIAAPEVKSFTMRGIAGEYAKAGNPDASRKLFRQWPESETGSRESSASLEDQVNGDIAEALATKDPDGALRTAASIHDPRARVEAYWGIVFDLISAGDKAHAKAALAELQTALGPNPVSYPMVFILAKLGMMPEAIKTAEALKGADPGARDAYEKSLTSIAILQAEAGDAAAALKTVAEIGGRGKATGSAEFSRHDALLRVARAQSNAGDPQSALKTLAGLPLNSSSIALIKQRVLFETAYAWAKAGDYPKALSLAKQMRHEGVGLEPGDREDAFRVIAAMQSNQGDPESAAGWAAALSDPLDRSVVYLGIAEGLLGRGSLETPEFFSH